VVAEKARIAIGGRGGGVVAGGTLGIRSVGVWERLERV
jgi:hypothetical protein